MIFRLVHMSLHYKMFTTLHVRPLKNVPFAVRVCVFVCVYLHMHFAKLLDPMTHNSHRFAENEITSLLLRCPPLVLFVFGFAILVSLTTKQYISAEQAKCCPEQKELSVIYRRLFCAAFPWFTSPTSLFSLFPSGRLFLTFIQSHCWQFRNVNKWL